MITLLVLACEAHADDGGDVADKAFDREIVNLRERPLSSDLNKGLGYIDHALRETLRTLYGIRRYNLRSTSSSPEQQNAAGFIGDGFQIRFDAGMVVTLQEGIGWVLDAAALDSAIDGVSGLDDLSTLKPVILTVDQDLTVPASDPGDPRIDIIEVNYDRRRADSTSRDVLNPATGVFTNTPGVLKTLTWALDGQTSINGAAAINLKTGTPAAAPVAPAVTAGYTVIARIRVNAGVVALTPVDVYDKRHILAPYGALNISMTVNVAGGSVNAAHVHAPPGVEVVVIDNASAVATTDFDVFIFAGDLQHYAASVIQAHTSASAVWASLTTIIAPNVGVLSVSMTAAHTADFANPVFAFPAVLNMGNQLGQKAIRLSIAGHRVVTGGVVDAPIPTAAYHINVSLATLGDG